MAVVVALVFAAEFAVIEIVVEFELEFAVNVKKFPIYQNYGHNTRGRHAFLHSSG